MTNKTGAEPASRGFRGSVGTAPQAHDTARKEERSTTTDGTQVRAQRGRKGVSEEGAIINRDLPPRRARRASLLMLLRESAGLFPGPAPEQTVSRSTVSAQLGWLSHGGSDCPEAREAALHRHWAAQLDKGRAPSSTVWGWGKSALRSVAKSLQSPPCGAGTHRPLQWPPSTGHTSHTQVTGCPGRGSSSVSLLPTAFSSENGRTDIPANVGLRALRPRAPLR